MATKKSILIMRPFIPVAFYFFVLSLAEPVLNRYRNIGPVDGVTGQPVFENFYAVLHYGFIGFVFLCLLLSLWLARKIPGKASWAVIAVLALLVPVQYFSFLVLLVSLSSK